jgi:hypothetical protein
MCSLRSVSCIHHLACFADILLARPPSSCRDISIRCSGALRIRPFTLRRPSICNCGSLQHPARYLHRRSSPTSCNPKPRFAHLSRYTFILNGQYFSINHTAHHTTAPNQAIFFSPDNSSRSHWPCINKTRSEWDRHNPSRTGGYSRVSIIGS